MLCKCFERRYLKRNYDEILAVYEPKYVTPFSSNCNFQFFEDRMPCASSLLIEDLNHEKMDEVFGEPGESKVTREEARLSIQENHRMSLE